jgi:hypothetical protein
MAGVLTERPLNRAEKAALALSGAATILLCYAFSILSILLLLLLLAVELVVLVGAARFGLARNEARRYLLSALNLEEKVGPRSRTAVELFHAIVGQLMMLEEPRENCVAWIATFPAEAQPTALAQRSLMLYGTSRSAAETHLNEVLAAMQPGNPVTPAGKLQWREAPKHQQPARPVREGVQFVL